MSKLLSEDYVVIGQLVDRIKPLLAGHAPAVQGAALAELLAMHLAGHVVAGNMAKTREARAALLKMHVQMVRKMIPIVAREQGLPA